jgi:hypothetical protein
MLIFFNPLNPELNPICPLLALFGDHHILHVSRIKVKVKPGGIHRMFLLSPHPTRHLNRIISLYPPVYPVRAAALRAMTKESPSFVTTACQRDK